jgi:hypothetical protein
MMHRAQVITFISRIAVKSTTICCLDKGLYWLSCCSAQSLESELDIIH